MQAIIVFKFISVSGGRERFIAYECASHSSQHVSLEIVCNPKVHCFVVDLTFKFASKTRARACSHERHQAMALENPWILIS
jgi:hypothetical protein